MCVKITGGVYILLLIFNLVAASTIRDDQNKDGPKIKHHKRSKSAIEHKLAKAKTVDEQRPKTIYYQNEKFDEDNILENPIIAQDPKPIKTEDDVSRTGISDGTNTEINLDPSFIDYDLNESENLAANEPLQDYINEGLKDIHQDVLIDMKGRTGYMPSESLRPGIRSQIIPEEYVDNIFRPYEFRTDYFQQPSQNHDMMPQFFGPNKRFMYKEVYQPYQNLRHNPAAYFNRLSSREIVYPKTQNVPYIVSSEVCITCQPKALGMHEHNQPPIEIPYRTANGRSLEAEPIGSNSYPYVARDVNELSPDRDYEIPHGRAHKDTKQQEERVSKIMVQKSAPIVMNRRVGLAGYHIISGL